MLFSKCLFTTSFICQGISLFPEESDIINRNDSTSLQEAYSEVEHFKSILLAQKSYENTFYKQKVILLSCFLLCSLVRAELTFPIISIICVQRLL